jgi:hypothetical protein
MNILDFLPDPQIEDCLAEVGKRVTEHCAGHSRASPDFSQAGPEMPHRRQALMRHAALAATRA